MKNVAAFEKKENNLSPDKNITGAVPENPNSSTKAVEPDMTEQIVIPPARVWNRIEKILDQQDDRRKHANQLIAASFKKVSIAEKRKSLYLAAAAGVSVVAGIFWFAK